jgi:SAM-dependent methyltransferase
MKEEDIRKRDTLKRSLELVEGDCISFFPDKSKFKESQCPACSASESRFEFTKTGFNYVTCLNCGTLYMKNRPGMGELKQFYDSSPSTIYWINDFFMPVAEARREKIFRPRAEELAGKFGPDPEWLIGDIGAGFGLFLEEMRKLWPSSSYIAIEPSSEQAEICRNSDLHVECCFLEELSGYDNSFDLLTAFELFEHLYEPAIFLERVYKLLKPGGRLLLTTLNGEGFDIQILWEKARSIYPPCHMNFFDPESLSRLLQKTGFIVEQKTTPGQLDWDIVEGMITKEGFNAGRFWKLVSDKASPDAKNMLQNWIRQSGFSSHMRILAQKI